MAKINEIHMVCHKISDANLDDYIYTELYGGATGCTVTVNDYDITMGGSSSVFIAVNTIAEVTPGCYILGTKKNVINGSPNLGSISL